MEYVVLRNGVKMPLLGFGTWPLKGEVLHNSFKYAFNSGFKLFDTANLYENEVDLGNIISLYQVDRDQLFLTSKINSNLYNGRKRYLWINKISVDKAYFKSCKRLKTDYLDLYLLHSPFENYLKAWGEMISLVKNKKVRAIGVCNFDINKLECIKSSYGEYPMVNQIEMHPFNQQKNVFDFCKKNGIQIQAFSPFASGKILKELMENKILLSIASNHNKTIPQIILRWLIQLKVAVVPNSKSKIHIEENTDVFDFSLSEKEMDSISSLDRKKSYCNYTNIVV